METEIRAGTEPNCRFPELCLWDFGPSTGRSSQASRATWQVTPGVWAGRDRKCPGAGHSRAEAGDHGPSMAPPGGPEATGRRVRRVFSE